MCDCGPDAAHSSSVFTCCLGSVRLGSARLFTEVAPVSLLAVCLLVNLLPLALLSLLLLFFLSRWIHITRFSSVWPGTAAGCSCSPAALRASCSRRTGRSEESVHRLIYSRYTWLHSPRSVLRCGGRACECEGGRKKSAAGADVCWEAEAAAGWPGRTGGGPAAAAGDDAPELRCPTFHVCLKVTDVTLVSSFQPRVCHKNSNPIQQFNMILLYI